MSLMPPMQKQDYVRYYYPGVITSETTRAGVPDRDPKREADNAPAPAFAFSYYTVVSALVAHGNSGSELLLESPEIEQSPMYYINARSLSAEDVSRLPGDHTILLDNMRANGWKQVWHCRRGGFHRRREDDVLIEIQTAATG